MRATHKTVLLLLLLLAALPLQVQAGLEDFPLNREIFAIINGARSPLMDSICNWLVFLGTGWVLVPILLLVIKYRRRQIRAFLMGIALNFLVVNLLKSFFSQPRPTNFDGTFILGDTIFNGHVLYSFASLHYGSFPSGDVAQSAMLAAVLWPQKWQYRILWILFVLAIAWERMYGGVHFPLDVTSGAIIGACCGWLARILTGSHIARNRRDEK
jgi:membrane-associated phospholipid phosphatase